MKKSNVAWGVELLRNRHKAEANRLKEEIARQSLRLITRKKDLK